jgi:hypothetical protein
MSIRSRSQHVTRELFRFARVRSPRVIDLSRRSEVERAQLDIGDGDDARRQWAEGFIRGETAIAGFENLHVKYLERLRTNPLEAGTLPCRDDLVDRETFDGAPVARSTEFASDRQRTLRTLLAHEILGDQEKARSISRILQVIELYPRLAVVKTRRPFAPLVRRRFDRKGARADRDAADAGAGEQSARAAGTLGGLRRDLELLGRAHGIRLTRQRARLQELHIRQRAERAQSRPPLAMARQLKSEEAAAAARAYAAELRARREELSTAREAFMSLVARRSVAGLLDDDSDALRDALGSISREHLGDVQARIRRSLDERQLVGTKPCELVEEVSRLEDKDQSADKPIALPGCFGENPRVAMTTAIRPLGSAALVTVEEAFLRYTEGEINYIENILAGELRRREVKDTKYAEQVSESETRVLTDVTSETSAKVSSSLRSQVQSELNTSFNSDVNASASGTGGGTIGVVEFEGGAALDAGFGIGVDTSLSTDTENEFAQEILSKSIENTKQATLERRVSRTYALYEASNLHRIDNTAGDHPTHRRGVYCFLDKHVCITEKVYGHRLFLLANVRRPGHNLLCEQRARVALDLQQIGGRPVFDIAPDDVQPSTYKALAGRFGGAKVEPPPEPLIHLARTYKTDQTNADSEPGGGFDPKKLAQVLVPFFERYKRHLITDTITLPEGYRVHEVRVAVNHGANGVSVPAHLPLTAAGASIYSLPLMGYTVLFPLLYAPLTLWQIAYLASPLLHYNVDSSNVTVSVGTESQDSPYYFFPPDFLVAEIFDMLGNFAALSPGIFDAIKSEAETLLTALQENTAAIPTEVRDLVVAGLQNIVTRVQAVFDAVLKALDPTSGEAVPSWTSPDGELKAIADAMGSLTAAISLEATNLSTLLASFYTTWETFITNVLSHLQAGIESALSEFLSFLLTMADNAQELRFVEAHGTSRELPVSINAVTIKPGITVNLVACLQRTDEALDRWRLDTYGALYQAYLQQAADYDSRNFTLASAPVPAKSPGTLRQEEHRALKEILLYALNNYHVNHGNEYSLERINLFENTIDWQNLSCRLFNYGPNLPEIQMERHGLFKGADARRRAFLTAHWAQVMIPLHDNEHLETRMLKYFESGEANLDGDLTDDELTALYQTLVQERALTDEKPEVTHRVEILPTDLIVLKLDDGLPENQSAGCYEPPA